jgi:hypothetical protein
MRFVLVSTAFVMFSATSALADPGAIEAAPGGVFVQAPKSVEPQTIASRTGKFIYNIQLVRKSTVSSAQIPTCIVYVAHYGGESYLEEKRVNGKQTGNGWECKFELHYNWPKASDVSKVTANIRYQMGKDNWPALGSAGDTGVTYGSRTLAEIPVPANGGSATFSTTFYYLAPGDTSDDRIGTSHETPWLVPSAFWGRRL